MKRLFSTALALCLTLTLAACGGPKEPADAGSDSASGSNPPAGSGSTSISSQEPADSGSAQPGGEAPVPAEGSKFVFQYKGCPLPMNAEFAELLAYIGEPANYFEAESCAFNGLDKTYTYDDIEIITYPVEGVDFISSVRLLSDAVATPEGITLGSTDQEVIAAYGSDYRETPGQYMYMEGDAMLQFLFQDGVVSSVEYVALNNELI